MMRYYSTLFAQICLLKAVECTTCIAPEFIINNDGVRFTPNRVLISEGDQAIVQCEVEYNAQEKAPQSFMYVNDCKMLGYNHPTWITKITQTDSPCSLHGDQGSSQFRTLTMYINGTAEAHGSRVYCCARFGSRVCSINSTIIVVEAPLSTPTHITEQSIQPTKTVSDSQTMTSGASYTFKPIQVPHTAAIPSSSPPAATKFPDLITSAVENSQNAVKCSLTLLAILLTNILVVMFYL